MGKRIELPEVVVGAAGDGERGAQWVAAAVAVGRPRRAVPTWLAIALPLLLSAVTGAAIGACQTVDACRPMSAHACLVAGKNALRDRPAYGVKLLVHACRRGESRACDRAAVELMAGQRVARDNTKAAELARLSCRLKSKDGCMLFGGLLIDGLGVERDVATGVQLVRAACLRSSAIGCNFLAQLYRLGRGVARDSKRAAALEAKACAMGYKPSCGTSADKAPARPASGG